MVFSSTIFLFIFLPIVLNFNFLIRNELKNTLLFFVSLGFYFWGEQWLVIFLIISVILNYILALILEKIKSYNGGDKEKSISEKLILMLAVLFNLSMLGYFKYSNFFFQNIINTFSLSIEWKTIILPIGISFYTFQALSYVIDVYRDDVKATKNIIDFGCYLTFFPQLIAGPIVRYVDISKQLKNRTNKDRLCE